MKNLILEYLQEEKPIQLNDLLKAFTYKEYEILDTLKELKKEYKIG